MITEKSRFSQNSYKTPLLESHFKTEHLEAYIFIEKDSNKDVLLLSLQGFHNICVEHPRKSAYITVIMQPFYA